MAPHTRSKSAQKGQSEQTQPEVSSRSTGNNPQATKKTGKNSPRTAIDRVQKTVAETKPHRQREKAAQPSKRDARAAESLAAVNGVVIPSKVPPGESPNQGIWVDKAFYTHPCSICGRRFTRKEQVSSHMPACVERNGNPNGVRWDDAWSHNDQHDNQSQDDETESNISYVGLTADMLADQSLSDESPYNGALRMNVLSNWALLEMVEGWQVGIRYTGRDNAEAHPHYQELLEELVLRGMVDRAGHWLVDPDKVDMKFVRVG